MSIAPVWAHGQGSMPSSASGSPELTSADAAKLDSNIQQCVDKSKNGDQIIGLVRVSYGAKLLLESSTASVNSNNQNIVTASGGRVQCGHGDVPQFVPGTPLARVPLFSVYEQFDNPGKFTAIPWPVPDTVTLNWQWFSKGPNGSPFSGTYDGTNSSQIANGAAVIPITRVHDGSVIDSVTVYFQVNAGRGTLPTRYPSFNLFRFDPLLGITTSLTGWTAFVLSAPVTIAHYRGVKVFSATSIGSTVDVSKYLYFLSLLDEDYVGEGGAHVPNEFCGVYVGYLVETMQPQ